MYIFRALNNLSSFEVCSWSILLLIQNPYFQDLSIVVMIFMYRSFGNKNHAQRTVRILLKFVPNFRTIKYKVSPVEYIISNLCFVISLTKRNLALVSESNLGNFFASLTAQKIDKSFKTLFNREAHIFKPCKVNLWLDHVVKV